MRLGKLPQHAMCIWLQIPFTEQTVLYLMQSPPLITNCLDV